MQKSITLCVIPHPLWAKEAQASPSICLAPEDRQNTKAGEREVQKALRKVIYIKYKIKDQDLFDKAFGYIRQYY